MKNNILKFTSNFILIIYIVILFIALNLLIKRANNSNEVPSFLGFIPMVVISGSMKPVINPGDLLILSQRQIDKISKGDIATYKTKQDNFVTHRVSQVFNQDKKTFYKFKGDSNNIADENAVVYEQLVGELFFRVPYGGYFIEFVKSRLGMTIFIIIPVLILIGGEIKYLLFPKIKE